MTITNFKPIQNIRKDQENYDKLYFHSQTIKSSSLIPTPTEIKHHHKIKVGIYNPIKDEKESTESTEIYLTEKEVLLFQELMHVIKDSGCGTVLRVAGGWVRDKLRGDDSNDIDITLDNMMGEAFAELVNKHLSNKNHQTHRIGVIQSNPEQSKHLETATVKIFDMWIDFVNLRSETYTDQSRIPEISIGTPIQDALRRDLTINSLFFNINENRIEDLTGKGITDLTDNIVRTPLPSLTTFLDDPLRVFRSIRFASRLDFKIDQELFKAGSDPIVRDAIKSKISHERIAKEFDGMLTGKRPDNAIDLIIKFGLYDCLFSLPTSGISESDQELLLSNSAVLSSYKHCFDIVNNIEWGVEYEEIDTKRQKILSSLMLPYHGFTFKNASKKNKEMTIIHYMFVEYIKLSNKDYDDVILILDASKDLEKPFLAFNQSKIFNRKDVGLIIHRCGQLWVASILMLATKFGIETKEIDEFVKKIKSENLVGIWNLKRMLNGKQVQDLLNKKPGVWLAPVVQSILEWQLENPLKTEQDCKDWLLSLNIK